MATDMLDPSENAAAGQGRGLFWFGVLALPLLTFLMFADVLFSSENVLSDGTQDVVLQGLPWREFGFRHLREGNLPLWNPHIFLGMPFVGAMQSAMFYPPNWVSLLMPAGLATNWLFALHILLGGWFLQLWARRRGLYPLACVVAGALLMFSGPLFLRIRAGHVPPISAMPWVVLTFLAIDEVFKAKYFAGWLTGMGALAMSILAGHPQYFFCTVVAGGIYSCLRLSQASGKWLAGVVLIGMLLGAALAAVQLLPGMEAAKESVRSAGLPYGFAATYSLPPEGFISLVVPGFFGDCAHVSYWGRWNMWESSLFIGATGLVLAVYGAIYGEPSVRCFSITMVVILLLLALGAYTPLFPILYTFVPGFNQFRSISRFAYPAAMFLCLLAGIGLDRLIREPRGLGRTAAVIAGVALLCGILAAGIHLSVADDEPAGWWKRLVNGIEASGQIARAPQEYTNESMRRFGEFAVLGLLIASGTLAMAAALVAILRTRRTAVYGIAALAVIEVFVLAWLSRDTFALSQAYSADVDTFLAEHPGDYRIFNTLNPDAGMVNGADDVLGYDSMMPLRMAELIAATQGRNESALNVASHLVYPMGLYHPFYKALRFRYLIQRIDNKTKVQEFPDVLPQLQLVHDCRVIQNRDDVLLALNDAAFDPGKTVILESSPGIECEPSAPAGTVSLVEATTDRMWIEAETPAPAILLVTDGWSEKWVAHSVDGSKEYPVMPADYVLRDSARGRQTLDLPGVSLGLLYGREMDFARVCGDLRHCRGRLRARANVPLTQIKESDTREMRLASPISCCAFNAQYGLRSSSRARSGWTRAYRPRARARPTGTARRRSFYVSFRARRRTQSSCRCGLSAARGWPPPGSALDLRAQQE